MMIIKNDSNVYDTSKMSKDELLELQGVLLEANNRIKSILDMAKAQYQASGEYADPVWFAQATIAQRIKGEQLQKIQREIKRCKNEVEKAQKETFAQAFLAIAREELPPDIIKDMLSRAGAMIRCKDSANDTVLQP